jgi:hypothetical protein
LDHGHPVCLRFFVILLGENAHIRVHDNLDSNIAWYKVLARSGEITGPLSATIPQVNNGRLPRNALGSEFTGIVWLHALFPKVTAYALSQTIMRIVALIGMYLLLKSTFCLISGHFRLGWILIVALLLDDGMKLLVNHLIHVLLNSDIPVKINGW